MSMRISTPASIQVLPGSRRSKGKRKNTRSAPDQSPTRILRSVKFTGDDERSHEALMSLFYSTALEARARFEMAPHMIDIYL